MLYLGPSALPSERDAHAKATITDWQGFYQQQAAKAKHPLLKEFYQAGMVAADTPIGRVPLLALDMETTGLDPAHNGIASIGLMPMNFTQILSSQAQQWLLKPRFELSDSSVTVHRITHSEIAQAPDLEAILPALLEQMAGKVIVVHYQAIERPFLHAALLARLGEGIHFPVIDTMELEARLHRTTPLTWWQKLRGARQESIRLAASRTRYKLPPYRPHHATTDALACAELLQAQLAKRFKSYTPVADLWS